LSIIQGPFSVAPRQTLISRFATFSSPYSAAACCGSAASAESSFACSVQHGSPPGASFTQPSCWQRLAAPCVLHSGDCGCTQKHSRERCEHRAGGSHSSARRVHTHAHRSAPPHAGRSAYGSTRTSGSGMRGQPSSRQRLSVPCGLQYGVAANTALSQPSCWQRLPPPCRMQYCVAPRAAVEQPGMVQRLPPPCALQNGVHPRAAVPQPSCWQRFPAASDPKTDSYKVGIPGGRSPRGRFSRPPPVSLDTSVPRTQGYTHAANVWDCVPRSRTLFCRAPRAKPCSSSPYLPPPCALQCSVLPMADLVQLLRWQRFPPPCALQ
jgi:hypothetical protein